MGLEFIGRTLRTYGIVLLIFVPFGLYYAGVFPTIAILSGGVWGMINLMFLTELVKAIIRPEGVLKERAMVLGLVKFPLLYGALFALIRVSEFEATWLVAGFSGVFVILLLKAAGRVLLGIDSKHERRNLRRASL